MRIGLQIPYFNYPGGTAALHEHLAAIARTAEDAGFYSIWVMDHFFQLEGLGPVDDPMLEGYSTLGYLAAITERVKLGTLVTGVIYRYPAILIKTVTTLDVLSGGRAYFGVGAAWFEREAKGLGVPFPSIRERFEWLEETLHLALQMWSSDSARPYQGKHLQMAETLNSPQSLSQPHPPIMIGGMGEQKTLRFVAQYADACNLSMRAGTDVLRHKLEVLRGHCKDFGRDYDTIEKTSLGSVHLADGEMSADDVIAQCRELADLGIEHAIFNMPNAADLTPLKIFGETIIPTVRDF